MLTPMMTQRVCYVVDQHPITIFTFVRIFKDIQSSLKLAKWIYLLAKNLA
jgi:hypothetical protein